jgi:hypothetical protein
MEECLVYVVRESETVIYSDCEVSCIGQELYVSMNAETRLEMALDCMYGVSVHGVEGLMSTVDADLSV